MGWTKGLICGVFALAAWLFAAPAEAGVILSQHFASNALGRDWTYNVYLPDGYDFAQGNVVENVMTEVP